MGAQFGQVTANQRKVVILIKFANSSDTLHRRLVAKMTAERIARIRRIDDDTATPHQGDSTADQALLGIGGVNL